MINPMFRCVCRALLVTPLFVSLTTVSLSQTATVSEKIQTIRTYPYGDPDPVPRMGNIYPYFRFQGYSIAPVDHPWKIVTLENPYIRVLIAPEVGGKVLGAIEKASGRPFIYYNRVIKFREIAMRGPWTSGGIEFNFGDIGHAPTTASPVDYITRKNADGSVSCIVGALDLPSRTEWRVEIRLPRDKAMFETRSFWYNPTDLSTSLYHWTNAAADADSTLQVLYPGKNFIGHGGEPSPWPVDAKGRDLSYYRNNAFGSYKSYHVLGTYTDFFGARWGDFGVIHWSPYTEKPGKKLWIWGLSREGEIWRDLLTDPPNSQYVEIQSGLHFNQAIMQSSRTPFKHMVFLPHSSESFGECWFPFQGLDGVTRATPDGALHVQQAPEHLTISFCPTGAFHDVISLVADGKLRSARSVTLRPLQTFRDTLRGSFTTYEVRVGKILRYDTFDDSARVLQRRIEASEPMNWSSAHGLAVDARERMRQRDYAGALASYRASLSIEPTYLPSLSGAAELLLRSMELDSSLALTLRALAVDTYDPESNYLFGLVQRELGHAYDAREAFGIAARSRTYRPAALLHLAELAAVDSDWTTAEEYCRRVLENDAVNIGAHRLLSVLYRRTGDSQMAARTQRAMLERDPLSHFAGFEAYLLSRSNQVRKNFTRGIRGELPHETYLELAAYYMRLRAWPEAKTLLSLAPEHPMVDLWRAYVEARLNNDRGAKELLDRALAASPAFVFPFRQEESRILRWALQQHDHWKLRYYLALLQWHYDRRSDAGGFFDSCGGTPDFAPFYLARAAFRHDDPARAEQDLREALRLDPSAWRTWSLLATHLNERGKHAEALRLCADAVTRFPHSYVLTFLLARTYVMAGDCRSARSILDTLTILPFEGSRVGRDVYRQANVLDAAAALRSGLLPEARALLSRARLWPERLGAGKPYETDVRLEDYLQARILRAEGDSAGARKLLAGITTTSRTPAGSPHTLVTALAYRDLGNPADGERLLTAWHEAAPADGIAAWSLRTYHADDTRMLEDQLHSSVLNPSSGDQEFILLVRVARLLAL